MELVGKRFSGHDTGKKPGTRRAVSGRRARVEWSFVCDDGKAALSPGQGADRKRARCSQPLLMIWPSHARFGSNKAHSHRINMQLLQRDRPLIILYTLHTKAAINARNNHTLVLRSLDQPHSKGQSPLSAAPKA